jgi:hypothetical protein
MLFRRHPARGEDIVNSFKAEAEGGTGEAGSFWEWCEGQASQYA